MCNSKVKVKVLREEWIRGVNLILLFSAFIVRLWIMIRRFLGVYAKKFIHVKVEILKGIHDIIKNGNFNKCHFEKKYKESSLAEFTHSNDFNWFFLHAQHVYSILRSYTTALSSLNYIVCKHFDEKYVGEMTKSTTL